MNQINLKKNKPNFLFSPIEFIDYVYKKEKQFREHNKDVSLGFFSDLSELIITDEHLKRNKTLESIDLFRYFHKIIYFNDYQYNDYILFPNSVSEKSVFLFHNKKLFKVDINNVFSYKIDKKDSTARIRVYEAYLEHNLGFSWPTRDKQLKTLIPQDIYLL